MGARTAVQRPPKGQGPSFLYVFRVPVSVSGLLVLVPGVHVPAALAWLGLFVAPGSVSCVVCVTRQLTEEAVPAG